MEEVEVLRDKLILLLQDHAIGVAYLTPLPRGGRLRGPAAREMEQALDGLASAESSELQVSADQVYGNGCFAVGRYDDAARVFASILSREPEDTVARFNLGLSLLRLKKPAQAVEELSRVLERHPDMPEAHYQRGNAHDDMGDCETALRDYATAIALLPDYLQAHFNRGVVLAQVGRHKEAVAAFDRAIELRPSLSNAYLNQGASLAKIG